MNRDFILDVDADLKRLQEETLREFHEKELESKRVFCKETKGGCGGCTLDCLARENASGG
jgi:hypothetical protein